MICKIYKNGNFTVRHESFFDGDMPADFHEFPSWLALHEDGFDVYEVGDFECWGNSYGAYYLKAFVNGELGYYPVTTDDYERYVSGRTVRFVRESLAPLFTMPPFYKDADYELDGVRGHIYWMCDPLTVEQREEIGWNGVEFLGSRCEYAPEIKSDVVFVPNGMTFSFC